MPTEQEQKRKQKLIKKIIEESGDNGALDIQVLKNNRLEFFVKTNKKWEKKIGEVSEVKTTRYPLMGEGKKGKFYTRLDDVKNYLDVVDDINSPILVDGRFNFGVFRVKGISEGKIYGVDELMTKEQINEILKETAKKFKQLYKLICGTVKLKVTVKEEDIF